MEKTTIYILVSCLLLSCVRDNEKYINTSGVTIKERVLTPEGYSREQYSSLSWQYFLQNLELLPFGSKILDYTGQKISEQSSHIGIIKYDVGTKDLQQCADAIIRLRAEYLWKQKRNDDIQFTFTSGHNYKWIDHANGFRPYIKGNKVSFKKTASVDKSYSNFRKYLDIVFSYAGTISLNRDLKKISKTGNYQIGDIIVKAGSPGHAVLIVDKCKNNKGEYLYLLAEGYTPAQSIHLLKSNREVSPWHKLGKGVISSKRYYFLNPNFRRF